MFRAAFFRRLCGMVSLVRVRTMRMCDGMSSLPSESMREIIGVFRHEALEKLFQVASRGRIGIFHDDDAATGVLNENGDGPISHAALIDLRLQSHW